MKRILSDPEVTRYLFSGRTMDDDLAREVFERRKRTWAEEGLGLWALELKETGDLVGWTGLQYIGYEIGLVGQVEVGWTLGREWWGRGLAPEAAETSLAYGFTELGLERIYALRAPENAKSDRVMAKIGMEPAGEAVDVRDGAVSAVRAISVERWRQLHEERAGRNGE
jgi:RimJ/RimL family protein N-acetyltransferase